MRSSDAGIPGRWHDEHAPYVCAPLNSQHEQCGKQHETIEAARRCSGSLLARRKLRPHSLSCALLISGANYPCNCGAMDRWLTGVLAQLTTPDRRLGVSAPWLGRAEKIRAPHPFKHGWFCVSAREAAALTRLPFNGGKLPGPGRELSISIGAERFWLSRTPHKGEMVWSIRHQG